MIALPFVSRERIAQARVLVVGDVMLDRYWFGEVNRISPEAPVPVVHVQRGDERLGGAANVASNISALGARAGLLCVVGTDEPGDRLLELFAAHHIDAHIERDSNLPTTIKLRVVARQQQLLRIDFEGQPNERTLVAGLARFKTLLQRYDVVLLSDYAKGALAHVSEMITECRAAKKIVLVDPKGDDWKRYRGASVITPNRAELRQVVGNWRSESELQIRVDALRDDLDLDAVLLTRSEEGMSLFTDEGMLYAPAEAKEVYDVSGAGDTVISTIASLLVC